MRPGRGARAAACECGRTFAAACSPDLGLKFPRESLGPFPLPRRSCRVGQGLRGFVVRFLAVGRRRARSSGAHVQRGLGEARRGPARRRSWARRSGPGGPGPGLCRPGRPTPGGEAGPLGTSCVRGKMAAPALLQGAQNGGRGGPGERAGESPTQRKRAFPSSAAASCDPTAYRVPSGHLDFVSQPLELSCFRLGEGTAARWSFLTLGGWRLKS